MALADTCVPAIPPHTSLTRSVLSNMSSMSGKLRVGIVGTGGIAVSHLEGYRCLRDAGYDRFEIAALCDKSPERRAAFAARTKELLGVSPPEFDSVEEMVEKAELDAADICTPHAFHHTAAMPCLEGGLDVMVEKPCGITVKATDQIISAAARNGRILAVAEQVRRGIKARTMRWALTEAKLIGDVRFFVVQGFSYQDYSSGAYADAYAWQWRLLKLLTGGGMIFDGGAHLADMMLHMFGPVEEVYCHTATFQKPLLRSPELGPQYMDVEDTWIATLRFESGLFGNWSWSFSAPGEGISEQLFYGTHGSARDRGGWMHPFQQGGDIVLADGTKLPYDQIEREFRDHLSTEQADALFPHGVEFDMALECWDFVDSAIRRRRPEVDGEVAKRAKSLCLALYESATAGVPVKVADVYSGRVCAYQDPINEYWGI